MFKEILVCFLCLVMLVGCDNAEKIDASTISNTEANNSKLDAVNTAIYLPGGAGIDFKKTPVSDEIVDRGRSKSRVIRYEFVESPEVVDDAVASILKADGYVRKQHSPGKEVLRVSYLKKGSNQSVWKYRVVAREGFKKITIITVSWHI